jgi:hypothetical protein
MGDDARAHAVEEYYLAATVDSASCRWLVAIDSEELGEHAAVPDTR